DALSIQENVDGSCEMRSQVIEKLIVFWQQSNSVAFKYNLTVVLDTAAGVWCDTKSVVTSPRTDRYSADAAGGDALVELMRRCRHAAAAVGDLIFIYGGLRGGVLLDDLLVAEDLAAAETTAAASNAAAAAAASNVQTGRLPGRYGFTDERTQHSLPESIADGTVVLGNPVAPPVNGDMYADISHENVLVQGSRRLSKGVEYLVEASAAEAEAITATLAAAKARQVNGEVELPDRDRAAEATPSGKQILTLIKPDSAVPNNTTPPGVRLHHRAVVVAAETGGALGGMVRQLSNDQFENKGRRVSYGTPESATAVKKLLDRQMSINSVPKKVAISSSCHFYIPTKVIAHLLKPRGWKPPVRRQFFLDCSEIAELCDSAERIFASEPSVLQLRAPIKIFGDLHGQFGDLMQLFDEYGAPSTAGDIADWKIYDLDSISNSKFLRFDDCSESNSLKCLTKISLIKTSSNGALSSKSGTKQPISSSRSFTDSHTTNSNPRKSAKPTPAAINVQKSKLPAKSETASSTHNVVQSDCTTCEEAFSSVESFAALTTGRNQN
ncbi:Serine/threonine-protein phosphatase bsl3, partial [Ancistrocladus abbreviatus]